LSADSRGLFEKWKNIESNLSNGAGTDEEIEGRLRKMGSIDQPIEAIWQLMSPLGMEPKARETVAMENIHWFLGALLNNRDVRSQSQ
jgi:hypothetical protein